MLTYYYTRNSRGNIVGIYNGAGQLRAHYEYDAWGNTLSVTDQNGNAITSSTHIGNLNPFRYRGYYLDTETGLYYLMSRYYDPVTHRFVNADGYFQSGRDVLDSNMSAYCRNNPISFVDPTGKKCKIHDPYFVGNCYTCNEDYRKFINDNIEWYNGITGQNIQAIGFDGTVYYKQEIHNVDMNSMEAKVICSIGAVFSGFEAEADVGIGIGCSTSVGIVKLDATVSNSYHAELSTHDGFDFGDNFEISGGISAWDVGTNFKLYKFNSYITGEEYCEMGNSRTISVGIGAYLGFGASCSVGYNYGYVADELFRIWG